MSIENRIRVAAYGRVSTDSKDQKNSFEHQKSAFDREYKDNPKYVYNEEHLYFDRGITGTKLSRPEFDKMLYDAGLDITEVRNNDNDSRKKYLVYATVPSSSRKPAFDLIIVRNTSRFSRNINATQILEQLRQLKVYVYFCDIDKTTKKDSDMEDIEAHLLSAERESRNKSRLVRFGTRESALCGVIRASNRIYGYKFIKGEHPIDNRLEIIEDEAEVIKKIYQWYIQGNGIRRIINLLSENNIVTREGKEFVGSSVKRILTNEKYMGYNVRNKYDTGVVFQKNSYPKVRKKEEWIIQKDTEKIPPIITEEDFEKVQKLLESKCEHSKNVGKYNGISEFAGKIVCGKCGAAYYANTRDNKRFYNCSTKKKYTSKRCNNLNVYINQINERISTENYRRDLLEMNVTCRRLLLILGYTLMKNIDVDAGEKAKSIKNDIDKMEEKKRRLIDIYTNGDINKDDYKSRIDPLNNSLELLNDAYKQYSKSNDEIINDILYINTTIGAIDEDFRVLVAQDVKKFKYSRADIIRDIQRITVREDGTLKVDYYKFKEYLELVRRHQDLLKVYIPDGDYDKVKDEILSVKNKIEFDIENKNENISNKMDNVS